jgi:membrane fusion protein (multidrug efflux system)
MTDEKRETGAQSQKQKAIYKRKRLIIPLILFLLISGAIASYWYFYLRGHISTDDAFIDADAMTISSKILGRITSIKVNEGDTVRPGQSLVQLDDSDLQAQKVQAIAALDYTQENLPVAKINIDRAQEDFDRASVQFKSNIIPREQYDHSRKALELARAQYNVAQSQIKTSEAQLYTIETQLRNTQISAPMPGVVARKWLLPGDIVQAGQPILTIYDLQNVWVTANFEETKLASIVQGDSVQISVDAYPGREFRGTVLLIGSAAASEFSLIPPNNASGNFTKVTQRVPVKISINIPQIDNPRKRISLLPGMSAEVKIRVKEK